MTEERIKELAEYHGLSLYTTARNLAETVQHMRAVIHAIVAEAREETGEAIRAFQEVDGVGNDEI